MTALPTTPSDRNYQIPTGVAHLTLASGNFAGQRLHLGNIVGATTNNDVQTKDHFKNSGGQRTKDKTRITQVGATIKMTLDEITPIAIAIFALGDIEDNSDGSFGIRALTNTALEGFLEITGDNDEGPRVDWEGDVQIVPSGDFSFMKDNDDWNQIPIQMTVLESSDGGFGLWTLTPQT